MAFDQQSQEDAEKAAEVVKRQEALRNDRGNWESHWEEVAEIVLPRYSQNFVGQSKSAKTKGDKRNQKQFDSTASLAAEKFAAAMESMLTPRQNKWHRLKASDQVLNRDRDVQLWFDQVTDILFRARYSPKANFATNTFENYLSLGVFGTGGVFIDEAMDGRGIRYRTLDLGGLYLASNHQGLVDTMYRRFTMTARQLRQRWQDNLPEKVKNAAEKTPDHEFEVVHCVRPREEVDDRRRDAQNLEWASQYVLVDGHWLLSEGGYSTFPLAVSRYVTGPDEIYGRSPAMLTLPDNKTLQEQEKTLLKQGHRAVDPVLLAHDDGVLDSFSLRPGAINYGSMTRDGKRLVDALPSGNVAVGLELMNQKRQVINEAFLVTLFQILVETPQMTATEVLERAQEKGALLSPTMGRQQSEFLGPMIERELDILNRQGLLPPMPPALMEAAGEFEIEYDSPLSRAQRAEEASGFMRTLEISMQLSQARQDPSPLDWLNVDAAIPEIANINAVPTRWVSSMEQVQQIRQQRQQAAQQQQAVEAAPAVSGVIQAASNRGRN